MTNDDTVVTKTGLSGVNSLPAAVRQKTYEYVYRTLRKALSTGQVPENTHLVETELAAQIGVSRTPVRDALRRLESEGFAERRPVGGLWSRAIGADEIEDLFLVRQELDKLAARLACERAKPEQWEQPRALIAAMGEAIAAHGPASDAFGEAHLAFHAAIYRIAFGARFAGLLDNILLQYLEIAADLSYRDPARTQPAVEQHERLLAELASGDVARAVTAAEAHVRRSATDAQGARADSIRSTDSMIPVIQKGVFVQRMFLNGTAMSGQKDHAAVSGAVLVGQATTAPNYRFFAVRDEFPGLLPVESGGASIVGELYEMTDEQLFDTLLPQEPRELELGSIELADGSTVRAMILQPERITAGDKVVDIADFGGFRAYQAHLAANSRVRDLLGL